MKIAYCLPFKPLDNPRPSGDVTIAADLKAALEDLGHEVDVLPHFPAKWIYWRPWRWRAAFRALDRMVERAKNADCVLTYSSYYKVPDVFGPAIARQLGLPYFLFSASYAPKRARAVRTLAGHWLNRRAMLAADHVFCNKLPYFETAGWLLPPGKYSMVRPGFRPGEFMRDEQGREQLRRAWGARDRVVICTAAMMRAGVKAEGLRWTMDACAEIQRRGRDVLLVIAGDGPLRPDLETRAREQLSDAVLFLGAVPREDMTRFYSAGDVFAFPGLEESIGMVYLEAQSCGVPVVATNDEGAPQVVRHEHSGLISPNTPQDFTEALDRIVADGGLRTRLGSQAAEYVREEHDLRITCKPVEHIMTKIVYNG
ncbi:glycosyltransferase family 4 protein [Salidesulfovibrio onnuriiensis]|uniref:glycosyltransferase family 4 protein n=1 Tax=Salidesulfovibrio onnuriiensis TaxID=2583823 RepID=UPI0011CAD236|nr:glycosyltransferase family 4 protein [Salidesulfovibrio onnuriiensis]